MTEHNHHHDILNNLNSQGRALRQRIPRGLPADLGN